MKHRYKTLSERQAIADNVRSELVANSIDGLEGVQPFLAILDDYVAQPLATTPPIGASGKMLVIELNRYIEYVLPVRSTAQEMVRLRVI